MDNNASERTVRGPSMGRKNYFGWGSLWSVCLTAAMFSIVATLKQWNLTAERRAKLTSPAATAAINDTS